MNCRDCSSVRRFLTKFPSLSDEWLCIGRENGMMETVAAEEVAATDLRFSSEEN
jgi:hypothetical protein